MTFNYQLVSHFSFIDKSVSLENHFYNFYAIHVRIYISVL